MKKLVFALLSTVVLLAADLTGTWDMTVEIAGNTGGPTFELTQTGSALKGKYSGAFGETSVTGQVNGEKFVIRFEVAPQGEKVELTYSGTVKADGSLQGTVEVPGFGEGTFTGTKRK